MFKNFIHFIGWWLCRSHSATQPLCQSGWSSHSATLPLCQSGWSSHSATQPLCHSARVAGAATQPLSHSEWLSGWVAATPTLAQWLSGWGENFRYCAFNQISPPSMESKMCILWTQTTTLSWRKAGLATLARWSRCWLATKRDSYKSGLCDSVHEPFRLTPHVLWCHQVTTACASSRRSPWPLV